MCSGNGMPGNSTTPSGKRGSSKVINHLRAVSATLSSLRGQDLLGRSCARRGSRTLALVVVIVGDRGRQGLRRPVVLIDDYDGRTQRSRRLILDVRIRDHDQN